jgi:hypothetical protein
MIRALRRYVIRKRFQKMVRAFDDAIEAARKAHAPVRPIQDAKSRFVHNALAGERS